MILKTFKVAPLVAFFYFVIYGVVLHYKTVNILPIVAQKEINLRLKININSISTVKYYPYQYKAELTLTNQEEIDNFIRTVPENISFIKRGEQYGYGWFNLGSSLLFDADNDSENLWLEVYRYENRIIYYRRNWDYDETPWFSHHTIF